MSRKIRKIIFWTHLVSGLVTGLVIAIMSVTGIAIAFEEEILAWVDRDQAWVPVPDDARPMRIEQLSDLVVSEYPDRGVNYVVVPKSPDRAYVFMAGHSPLLYANPYTGELKMTQADGVHDTLHELTAWHRFLGFRGDSWMTGRLINGVCNLAFLLLCITGLYIWVPRAMKWRLFKKALFFNKKAKGKARDFNWHHVIGIWSLPVLIVLSATAVVISFEWGHKIPFLLSGEEPSESRNFGMMAVPDAKVPAPTAENPAVLTFEQLMKSTQDRFPDWQRIGFDFTQTPVENDAVSPFKLDLTRPDHMPSRAWSPVQVDPYTGDILQVVSFDDRSPGLRSRIWVRFLHTGAAFGVWGKVIATLGTLGSLFLVYTGFALSYRRFFKRKRAGKATMTGAGNS